ncbi:MAG: hypothetical protein AAF235_04955 [Planctomycetota bacterium]
MNTHGRRGGFALVDVLVSVSVVALLVGIMLPAIAMTRASAKRLICSSQLRQLGLCLQLYTDDNAGHLVDSDFVDSLARSQYMPEETNTLRMSRGAWDGLGTLHNDGYMDAPGVYYCPGHTGDFVFEEFEDRFAGAPGEILAPYHYRAGGSEGLTKKFHLPPSRAMVTDLLGDHVARNHEDGMNVLRADASVDWVRDTTIEVVSKALFTLIEPSDAIDTQWKILDQSKSVLLPQ